ncbi:hypothetical protein C8J57DRAFT_1239690 [Mycena rebaudengoi]|nr:hypothetical protein C8J57DRAFT_1239690 [Mycena rebaudengoi]
MSAGDGECWGWENEECWGWEDKEYWKWEDQGQGMQGVTETLIPDIDPSNTQLDGYDWANETQNLQPSSEHGSDGEMYLPEPTQQDEMKRVFLRRKSIQGQERTDESPRFYAVGGPLDSQIESQVYISGLYYHAAGQSIHTQSLPLSPVLSPKPEHVELDIPDITINPVLSEADQLREEIQGLRERMDDKRARFFTSLEQANRERDKYREQAHDWEQQALNAVAKLQQARDLVGAKPMPYHDNRGKQHEKIFFHACQTSTPLAEYLAMTPFHPPAPLSTCLQ